jgi:hypothetical protein
MDDLPLHSFNEDFDDGHIAVKLTSFNPKTGEAIIHIEELVPNVGFYYILIEFESKDATRIQFDGTAPNRVTDQPVRTSHANDTILGYKIARVRD